MQRLKDKTALVTGAASGIGLAIARRFAAEGARVYLLDRDEAAAASAAESLQADGGQAFASCCDVSRQEECCTLVAAISAEHPIDILVNNAGIGFVGNIEQTSEADFDRLYQVNVRGVYNGMYAVIPWFRRQGGGVILNMASIVSSVGIPDRFAYSMTKGAVLTMTLSVAMDYIGDNIRCNCISPARVHTPFVDAYLQKNYPGAEQAMFDHLAGTQPIGRMATPAEVAALACFLCSEEAAFVTGCDYPLDGGFLRLRP